MLPKLQSLILFSCASVLLAGSHLPAAGSQAYTAPDFSNAKPIQLEITQQSGPLGARFVYPTSEGVEIEMLDGGGRIILNWGHMDQFQVNVPMTDSLEIALTHPIPKKRVKLLKAEIEPLLPMAGVPEGTTNLHDLINAYIKAEVDMENWLGAYHISQNMALDTAPASIIQHFYSIAVNLFVTGEHQKALNLLEQLVAARPPSESRKESLVVAQSLLGLRLFEPSYRLYRAIAEDVTGAQAKEYRLRCAYLCLELGEAEEATQYLTSANAIEDETTVTLGTQQIVLGVQASQKGEPALALNHLGHGLAMVLPDSDFKQIGLYFNYISYENLESVNIAEDAELAEGLEDTNILQNILDEMQLLFPDGAYTVALTAATAETDTTEVDITDTIETEAPDATATF